MASFPRVVGVVSQEGNDLSDLCNRLAEAEDMPPQVMVACGIAESNLKERAERWGVWPDVSFGLWQQTVAFSPIGDQTSSHANVSFVRAVLFDVVQAAEIAAPQLGRYWRQYGQQYGQRYANHDAGIMETLGRYNYPAVGYNGNPNAANIARAVAASKAYVGDAPAPPNADLAERWIAAMQALTGTPYVWGGKDVQRDGGLDCSGLLTSTAQAVGLNLGDPDYTSADGLKLYCDPLDESQVRRGAVILFHSTYGAAGPHYATHVGVWLEHGQMVDAHEPRGVGITNIDQPYWQQHLMGFWWPHGLAAEDGDDMPTIELIARIAELEKQLAELDSLLGYLSVDAAGAAMDALKMAIGHLRPVRGRIPAGYMRLARDDIRSAMDAVATIQRRGAPLEGG